MTKIAKFHDFFKYVNFFYGTIGMEAYTNRDLSQPQFTLLTSLIFYINFVNMNMVLLCEIIYVGMAAKSGQNGLEAIMTLSYIGFVVVGSVKTFIVWKKKSAITDFVQDIKRIFPLSLEAQQQYNLQHYMKECLRLSMMVSVIYMFAIWIFNLVAICQYLIFSNKQELPYYMYTMWEWQNHWSYYFFYLTQCLAGHTSAVGHFSSDLLLSSFVAQLIVHFQYVAQTLASYKVHVGQSNLETKKAQAMDMAFLKDIIQYHCNLLDLSDRLNQIFGYPLFMNFATAAVVICFIGFQMTIGASLLNLFKLSLFLLVMLTQAGLICYYGQLLMDASIKVAEAVYTQNWFNADVRYQKMLVLMAERAQKPVQLRATAFIPISHATITALMEISYKCFALLRTMYVGELKGNRQL